MQRSLPHGYELRPLCSKHQLNPELHVKRATSLVGGVLRVNGGVGLESPPEGREAEGNIARCLGSCRCSPGARESCGAGCDGRPEGSSANTTPTELRAPDFAFEIRALPADNRHTDWRALPVLSADC